MVGEPVSITKSAGFRSKKRREMRRFVNPKAISSPGAAEMALSKRIQVGLSAPSAV